jgi:23S rRNA pseudouridine955/2504/2580 synthase
MNDSPNPSHSSPPPLLPITVLPADTGARLLPWLKQQLPMAGFGGLQKALRSGQIRLDGKRCTGKERLQAGQQVRVPPYLRGEVEGVMDHPAYAPARPNPMLQAELSAMVLAETPDWIALNKPAGLAVQGGVGVRRSLDDYLPLLAEGGERLRLVHRLDKETSGLLLVARHVAAAADLTAAFRDHHLQKTYWALVWGKPKTESGVWQHLLQKLGIGPSQRMVLARSAGGDEGQFAETAWRLLAYNPQLQISWLALQPRTGRMHQLRVQCQAANLPILGDAKYGQVDDESVDALLIAANLTPRKLYLHARGLTMPADMGSGIAEDAGDQATQLLAPPPPYWTHALRTVFGEGWDALVGS